MNRSIVFLTLLLGTVGIGCSPARTQLSAFQTLPHTWIDAPLDGTALPPNPCANKTGSCIDVVSHSSDPQHIVQVELSVNGQVVQTSHNPDEALTLALTKQQWSPPGAGNYTLMVRAQNSLGVWGEYAQAIVTVQGTEAPPALVAPPLVVPTATAVSKPIVATPSPLPTATVAFYADATMLIQGQCTTIHWQTTNVSQVSLDNAVVNPSGSKQDCPTQRVVHVLRVVTLDGQNAQRLLTISVTAPSRTAVPTPTRTLPPPVGCNGTPAIASFSASPSSIPLGGSSTLRWGAVMNADSVEIDNGIGGVAAPGSRSVSPSVTTVYVLTARCKGDIALARTVVTVLQPPTATLVLRRLPTPTRTRTPIVPH